MDEIFQDVHGFKGAFTVVKVAAEKPHRFGKKGELLINYEDTEAYQRRRSSVAAQQAARATSEHEKVHGEGNHDEDKSVASQKE